MRHALQFPSCPSDMLVMPDDWIAAEAQKLVGLHPAFDPSVWDLHDAQQAQGTVVGEALALSERIAELEQIVAEQGRLMREILSAWTEGEPDAVQS